MLIIKKLIIVLVFAMSFTTLISQNEVVIEVDEEIFTSNSRGIYYSEDRKATIIAMVQSANFYNLIENVQKEKTQRKNVETGFILNQTIFFIKEIINKSYGEYMTIGFFKKNKDGKIISIMSGFPLSETEIYYSSIIEAVKSAKTEE